MRFPAALALYLSLCLPLAAQQPPPKPVPPGPEPIPAPVQYPEVTLPQNLKTPAGKLLKIEATSTGKIIRWALCSPPGTADLVVCESGRWAVFSAPYAGTYLIMAWTAEGSIPSDAAWTWVTVEGAAPAPPGPGPNPPGPGPPLPETFTKQVQDAYALEADAAKLQQVQIMAALYRQAAAMMDNDALLDGVKTYADLFAKLKGAFNILLQAGALPKVRAVVGAELNAVLGTDPAKLIDKQLCKAEFSKIATALGQVK